MPLFPFKFFLSLDFQRQLEQRRPYTYTIVTNRIIFLRFSSDHLQGVSGHTQGSYVDGILGGCVDQRYPQNILLYRGGRRSDNYFKIFLMNYFRASKSIVKILSYLNKQNYDAHLPPFHPPSPIFDSEYVYMNKRFSKIIVYPLSNFPEINRSGRLTTRHRNHAQARDIKGIFHFV